VGEVNSLYLVLFHVLVQMGQILKQQTKREEMGRGNIRKRKGYDMDTEIRMTLLKTIYLL